MVSSNDTLILPSFQKALTSLTRAKKQKKNASNELIFVQSFWNKFLEQLSHTYIVFLLSLFLDIVFIPNKGKKDYLKSYPKNVVYFSISFATHTSLLVIHYMTVKIFTLICRVTVIHRVYAISKVCLCSY